MMRIVDSTPLADYFHLSLADPTGYSTKMLQREVSTRIIFLLLRLACD